MLGDFMRDLNVDNASAGLVAGIFGLSAGGIHNSSGGQEVIYLPPTAIFSTDGAAPL